VAAVERRHRIAYFGLEEPLRSRHRLNIGVWAVRVEVGAGNLGNKPEYRWLRLEVHGDGGQGRPSIDLWPELDAETSTA